MVKQPKTAEKSRPPGRPWGSAIGLLAGCSVALAGIVLGLEPETVALRSIVGGVVVGFVVSVSCSLVRQWSS